MDIGKSINVGCARLKKRKKDLAAYTGVTKNTVSCWCAGKIKPTLEKLGKIAEFFGVKVSTFIEWGE